MRDLVVGVVVDVLREVLVEILELPSVGRVAGAARNLIVLNSGQFVVLDPEVGFEGFSAATKRSSAASPLLKDPLRVRDLLRVGESVPAKADEVNRLLPTLAAPAAIRPCLTKERRFRGPLSPFIRFVMEDLL